MRNGEYEKNYTFGNLSIRKTRTYLGNNEFIKLVEVIKYLGDDKCQILEPSDPDHKRALILSINKDNEF